MRTLIDVIVTVTSVATFLFGIIMAVAGAILLWDSRHGEDFAGLVAVAGFTQLGFGLLLACVGLLVALVHELTVRGDDTTT